LAKSKQPRSGPARPTKRSPRPKASRNAGAVETRTDPSRTQPGFERLDSAAVTTSASRRALADAARMVIARSGWQKVQDAQLARQCRELVARLRETCPDVFVGRPLKPGEVAGELALGTDQFLAMVSAALGAKSTPRTVWSDGTNELLVDLAKTSVKTTDGLVQTLIPVECNETGPKIIEVTFATGSPHGAAGLIFAAETVPAGPPEIVEIWGEALVALAWTAMLRVMGALADMAGTDLDGAGLVPAAISAERGGVKLLVMARHEMERVER
jgi:hypothetical protein